MTTIFQLRRTSIIAALWTGALVTAANGQTTMNESSLFTFDEPNSAKSWRAINDTVMGGVSAGGCRLTARGTLEFAGKVSLENNGGFASVRADTAILDGSAYDELVFRVRGDGQRFAISAQTDYRLMAGGYYFTFATKAGAWQEIRAPLRAFEARSFGRTLRGVPPLKAGAIRELGFSISDKQEGPFRLEIDWIKVANSRQSQVPGAGPVGYNTTRAAVRLVETAIDRGAPLFNAGHPQACADIYEIAARSIVDLSAAHLPNSAVKKLRAAVLQLEQTTDPVERAWVLRRAFDASLKILAEATQEI